MAMKSAPAQEATPDAERELALLRALNSAAASLQQAAHSEAAVVRTFKEQFTRLGLRGALTMLAEADERIVVRAVALPGRILQSIEALAGPKAEGYEVPLATADVYRQVIAMEAPVFIPDASVVVGQLLPKTLGRLAQAIAELTGRHPGIFAPIAFDGRVQGVLNVTAPGMTAGDVPAMAAFASHISIALNNARLFAASQEAEAQYRRLFESASDGILVIDPLTTRILSANYRAQSLTGRAEAELVGLAVADLDPAFSPEASRLFFEHVRLRGRGQFEQPLTLPNGQQRMVRVYATQFEVNGRQMVQGVMRDITERVQAEQLQSALYQIAAVANSEISLEALYRSIHEIIGELMPAPNFFIAHYDADADVMTLPYFVDTEDTYGGPYKPGKGLTEYVIRSGQPLLLTGEEHQRLIELGEVGLIGPWSPIWLGVPLKSQGLTFGAIVVQHYSDANAYTERQKQLLTFVSDQVAAAIQRKRAEEALRQSEERYRSFVEQSSEGIWRLEFAAPVPTTWPAEKQIEHYYRYGYLVECNDAMARMMGRERAEDVVGIRLAELLPPGEPQNEAFLQRFIDNGYRLIHAISHQADQRPTVRVMANNWLGIVENGQLVRAWGTQRDITVQKQAEEALRQTQKLESLGVLAGGVAHDFNNLLVAMLGQTSLALAQLPPDSPARDNIEKSVKAAERAADLTRQMLAYSGRGQFQQRPFDLNGLIADNLPLLEVAIAKNVCLHSQLRPPAALIKGDVGQLQQVVMNLILNAAEAIGERPGRVTVSTSIHLIEAGGHQYGLYTGQPLPPGSYIALEVTDDGCGMDAVTLHKIFDPFFTTKFTGRGLGLAAVLGIVRGHDGGLQVESQPGQGTTFRLLFPPATEAATTSGDLVGSSDSSRRRYGRILVIDDEEPVREAVTDILELEGLEVVIAADGLKGIELYRQQEAEIELVLMDLSMPGISAEETFKGLRAINADVQVILSSGYSQSDATRHFAFKELAGFLPKPYAAAALVKAVYGHLGQAPDEQQEWLGE